MTDSMHFWWRVSLTIIFSTAVLGWGIMAWRFLGSPEERRRVSRGYERVSKVEERAEERMDRAREWLHSPADTVRAVPATS
jgi:hypothetical protein